MYASVPPQRLGTHLPQTTVSLSHARRCMAAAASYARRAWRQDRHLPHLQYTPCPFPFCGMNRLVAGFFLLLFVPGLGFTQHPLPSTLKSHCFPFLFSLLILCLFSWAFESITDCFRHFGTDKTRAHTYKTRTFGTGFGRWGLWDMAGGQLPTSHDSLPARLAKQVCNCSSSIHVGMPFYVAWPHTPAYMCPALFCASTYIL